MKITVAKTAGFCMGVRRAVDIALDQANKCIGPIVTYGPLIHNPHVLELLRSKGVSEMKEIPESGEGIALIRAHGVPPEDKEKLKKAGFTVLDATCPRVIRVQSIIRKHEEKGYDTIIMGDSDHPEVIGLNGFAGDRGHVVNSIEDLEQLQVFEKGIIVAQTTQNTMFYADVKQWAKDNRPGYKLFDTICDSTEKRQAEIKSIAGSVDAVVVVGGKNSGNTQRLAEVALMSGKPSFHIEDGSELPEDALEAIGSVGVTAGASTPNWIITQVVKQLESSKHKKKKLWQLRLYEVRRFLILTNLFVALGAGCLAFSCMVLAGGGVSFRHIMIAFFYVLSMQIFNNLTSLKEDRFNYQERAEFYSSHTLPLALVGITAGAAGLLAAFTVGSFSFLLLFIMSILGLSYNLKLVPKSLDKKFRYSKISRIPGSKTILITMAWGMVTAILPAIGALGDVGMGAITAVIFSTGMVLSRGGLFDILHLQGDRIVGKETIPMVMGKKKAGLFFKKTMAGVSACLLFSSLVGIVPGIGFWLMLYPASLFLVFHLYETGQIHPGFRLSFLIESTFILSGIITLLWVIAGAS